MYELKHVPVGYVPVISGPLTWGQNEPKPILGSKSRNSIAGVGQVPALRPGLLPGSGACWQGPQRGHPRLRADPVEGERGTGVRAR